MIDAGRIAWAAGFFEAEGCIARSGRKLVLIVGNTDPEPLCRLAAYLKTGRFGGPRIKPGRKPLWTWSVRGDEADAVIDLFAPYLSRRRLAQLAMARAAVSERDAFWHENAGSQ